MTVSIQRNLMEPGGSGAFGNSLEWVEALLLGPMALTLSVLAVAFVGFLLLSGRLPIALGARVVMGCFILLGAPAIAAALLSADRGELSVPPPPPVAENALDGRGDLPPAEYNPYASASVRDDR